MGSGGTEYDPAADHSGEDDRPEEDVKDVRKNQLKQNLKEEAIKLYEVKEAEFPEAEQIRETGACGTAESYRQKMDGSYR